MFSFSLDSLTFIDKPLVTGKKFEYGEKGYRSKTASRSLAQSKDVIFGEHGVNDRIVKIKDYHQINQVMNEITRQE